MPLSPKLTGRDAAARRPYLPAINLIMDATIVIPVFNQLHYTRQCLESLNAAGCPDAMIVVVNNASTDGTTEFLATRPALRVITNAENRACAAAWNQGFQASATGWILFLNNDVVTPRGWLENLVAFAEESGADLVSPALGEGELNYDLANYARDFMAEMRAVWRRGIDGGVCFLVHRRVFASIGEFDENFRHGGNEDVDFFWRARNAGFKLVTTGSSYLHHFGNVTQRALAQEHGSTRAETVGYFRTKWKIGWWQRRWSRWQRKLTETWQAGSERRRHGHTLREWRAGGKIFYR